MNRLFDPGFWGRALRNPIVLTGLAVDLAPIYAVLVWGWGATPLVLVYWIENVITGVMTLPRIFISGANFGLAGLGIALFMCAFFTVHYGLFCTVHGIFLVALSGMAETMQTGSADAVNGVGQIMDNPLDGIPGIIRYALASATHVDWMLAAIVAWQVVVFLWEFILRGGWKTTNPGAEMFAPYGRIVVLHFGIFVGFGALMLLGQPMIGVLALIVFRAVWGVFTNDRRANPLASPEGKAAKAFNDAMKQLQSGKPS